MCKTKTATIPAEKQKQSTTHDDVWLPLLVNDKQKSETTQVNWNKRQQQQQQQHDSPVHERHTGAMTLTVAGRRRMMMRRWRWWWGLLPLVRTVLNQTHQLQHIAHARARTIEPVQHTHESVRSWKIHEYAHSTAAAATSHYSCEWCCSWKSPGVLARVRAPAVNP